MHVHARIFADCIKSLLGNSDPVFIPVDYVGNHGQGLLYLEQRRCDEDDEMV